MESKYCSGCGIKLQNSDKQLPGYIVDIYNQNKCLRCFKLLNYGQLYDFEFDLDQFKSKLINVIKNKDQNKRFFYVVDSINLKGSRLLDIEELIKNNDVIICVNKIDIFPNIINKEKIYDFALEEFRECKITSKKLLLLSSKNMSTIDNLIEILKEEGKVNYFFGMSNTGKSSLINSVLHQLKKEKIVTVSRFTNTTIDFIEVDTGLPSKVIDSPGIAVNNSIANAVDPKYWYKFVFKNELKQYTYRLKVNNSIVFDKIAWFEIIESRFDENSIHVWTNDKISMHRTNSRNIEKYLNNGFELVKPIINEYESKIYEFFKEENIDIVISGLGWIGFRTHNGLKVKLHFPKIDNKIAIYKTNKII